MTLKFVFSRLEKYLMSLRQLNQSEDWGLFRSLLTYFDYLSAFIMHGCLVDQYVRGKFYKYKGFERKRMITQRRLTQIIHAANSAEYIHLLENKPDFNRHFCKWVRRKWLKTSDMSKKDFDVICKDGKALFVKPLDAYEGKGIRRIEVPSSPDETMQLFDELKKGLYIIEQELTQHPAMIFGNRSVNTLRINTLLDRDGHVHFFKPVLRAGIGDAFVDKYNAGGVEYAVDIETGIITMPGYRSGEMLQIFHPGTDIKMIGYQIPLWNEVINTVREAARHIPQCRYIGWDVAITPEGIEFIEGNHNPGYVCMEYFGETGWYEKLRKHL